MSAVAVQTQIAATYRLVATHCAACKRDLRDPASVERGMGPDCAKKYGIPDTLDPEQLREAREAVHRLALHASGAQGIDPGHELTRLHASGAWRAAEACGRLIATVTIQERGAALVVRTPYLAEACADWARIGATWNTDLRARVLVATPESRLAAWAVLRRWHAGEVGIGPKGPFTIHPLNPTK